MDELLDKQVKDWVKSMEPSTHFVGVGCGKCLNPSPKTPIDTTFELSYHRQTIFDEFEVALSQILW